MTSVVMDASAVLALVRDEPGADKVTPYVGRAAISAINLQEVIKEFLLSGLDAATIREILPARSSPIGSRATENSMPLKSAVPLIEARRRLRGTCTAAARQRRRKPAGWLFSFPTMTLGSLLCG
jgi:PIN domain nuclease of toxin-antitoxin system